MKNALALAVAAALAVLAASAMDADAARMPLPTTMPTVVVAACPGIPDAAGCYQADENTAFVDGDAFTLRHELGHAFDAQRLDPGSRHRFLSIIGHPRLAWIIPTAADSFVDGGNERFADAYAHCSIRGGAWDEAGSSYAPSLRVHRRVCAFIRRVAR